MKAVLLAPHNDDETLFASFQLLEHKPDVVTVLRNEENYAMRELETAAAMRVFDCDWHQWAFSDRSVPWQLVWAEIKKLADTYEACFAPAPRWAANQHDPRKPTPDGWGVLHHDRIGQMAMDAFGDRYIGYTTYLRGGLRDRNGTVVNPHPDWILKKLTALLCYRSQIMDPNMLPHFMGDLNEYLLPYEPPQP